jgi:serine/threonine protein kinase
MEHVPGGTMETLIGEEARPWDEVAGLIIPVARALAYAHSKGIIHCDVKPSNILLSRPDWPLLADFGLLRLQDQQTAKPGSLTGTPTYASPEQIMGENLTGASDVYSLGLVLYQLVTGHMPFGDFSSNSAMLQRLLEHPVPPSVHVPTVRSELEHIVLRALARKPADRFESMGELISALEQLPGSSESGSLTQKPPLLDKYSSTQALSEPPPAQGPHLVITGTGTILSLPAREKVVLGRVTLHDDDPPDVDLGPHGALQAGVSRRHACLHYAAEGWLLEDLGSTNGTSLNNMRVKRGQVHRIRSGDIIHCGRLMLVFFDQ